MFGYSQREQRRSTAGLKLWFGILAFFVSFPALWMNEGRTNFGKVAARSVPIDASQPTAKQEGQLIAALGTLAATEPLADEGHVRPGSYLVLQRKAEMFAWVESYTTQAGSEKFYRYKQEWVEQPANSHEFHSPQGHENLPMSITSVSVAAKDGYQGELGLRLESLRLPRSEPLILSASNTASTEDHQVSSNYLYLGNGSLDGGFYCGHYRA